MCRKQGGWEGAGEEAAIPAKASQPWQQGLATSLEGLGQVSSCLSSPGSTGRGDLSLPFALPGWI